MGIEIEVAVVALKNGEQVPGTLVFADFGSRFVADTGELLTSDEATNAGYRFVLADGVSWRDMDDDQRRLWEIWCENCDMRRVLS